MIAEISQSLFADEPVDTLYHYTSLSGLMGIVDTQILRASDIRYMNDSTELKHTLNLLRDDIVGRLSAGSDHPVLLNQLLRWLSTRVVSGPMLFGGSFRANGNLLSQWRGYSVHGKGVSLGFDPAHIGQCARNQDFQVGKCIYEVKHQQRLAGSIIDALEALSESTETEYRDGKADYHRVFEQLEGELLKIAAILKHPSFEEEQEWRIVSPVIFDCRDYPVFFREGHSMLVPYYSFLLRLGADAGMPLRHVYVGPTGNRDLSMNSVKLYLQKQGVEPSEGIDYCQIPYRAR